MMWTALHDALSQKLEWNDSQVAIRKGLYEPVPILYFLLPQNLLHHQQQPFFATSYTSNLEMSLYPQSVLSVGSDNIAVDLGEGTLKSCATAGWQVGRDVLLNNLFDFNKKQTGHSSGMPQLFAPGTRETTQAVNKTISEWRQQASEGKKPDSFDCSTAFSRNLAT